MNILVKGMEMPTDCTECWFRQTARHEYLSDCQICPFTGETTPYTKRKDDCPLVPVPPHGRLIDENELIKSIHDDWDDVIVWDESGVTTADEFERLVYEQPTIIEAEEGDKNDEQI